MLTRAAIAFTIALVPAAAASAAPPRISAPPNVVAEATSPAGAVVTYRKARAPGALSIAYSRRSGALFPLGKTVVTVTARYGGGKTARARFAVTVVDTTAPVFGAVADIASEATSGTGAAVAYAAPAARDLVDGNVSSTCSPAPGSTVPLGATAVTCTARDRAGNSASATFSIKVVDTTPPRLSMVDLSVVGTSSAGGSVAFSSVLATDRADPSPAVTCSPAAGSFFPIGTTTVSCTARDASGNTASGTFKVEVVRPAPATVGNYSGTTSGGASIAFRVTSGGATVSYVVDVAVPITASCSPDGALSGTLTIAFVNVNSDGTFSRTGPGSVSGEVSGTVTTTFAGQFATSTSATGTINAVVTLTSGQTCNTGTITWSASRS